MLFDRQPHQRQRILIAPTAYKGTLSVIDVARTIAESIEQQQSAHLLDLVCVILPLTDGGTDTLACLLAMDEAGKRWQTHTQIVTGPLPMQKVNAMYLSGEINHLEQKRAEPYFIVEAAQAHGMTNLPKSDKGLPILSPLQSTSYGVGELIQSITSNLQTSQILEKTEIVMTLGGSASTDAGAGALQALGWQFYSTSGLLSQPLGGKDLCQIDRILPPVLRVTPQSCPFSRLSILMDVNNPLLGPLGTVSVFSPQKGAMLEEQELLEAGLKHFHSLMKKTTLLDFSEVLGVGAAGGLAYGLMHHTACLGISYVIQSGFEWYADQVDLRRQIAQADCIISGEGCLDSQSFGGKSIGALIHEIQLLQSTTPKKKLALFCGKIDLDKMKHHQWNEQSVDSLSRVFESEYYSIYAYALEDFQHFETESICYPDRVLNRAVNHWVETVLMKA